MLLAGCSYDPYEGVEVELTNKPSGVTAGRMDNLIIMKRGDQRQVISISHMADDIRLLNCEDVPVFYIKMHFLGKEGISILKVELPPTDKHLNRYYYRQLDTNKATVQDKTVHIVKLNQVSPDGKTMNIEYKLPGTAELKPGILEIETMKILEP